jgi:hypothetical protein
MLARDTLELCLTFEADTVAAQVSPSTIKLPDCFFPRDW